ncbi:MAG: hypothetical protein QOI74_723 [Micromonosporaceae bacterium]|nr:hypothetical protein [Micromonosporaceae bacterium]
MHLPLRPTTPGQQLADQSDKAPRAPHRRPGGVGNARRALAVGTAVALAAGVFAAVSTGPADAATVGAGSYLTTPVGAGPTGCGAIATNPRAWVTANAPAGAVPTNDWWSSILWKRTNCAYGEPLHSHPVSYQAGNTGLGFSYNTTAAISGTATGVGEFHYPYVQDFVAGVAGLNSPDVKVDSWSDWTVTPFFSDGARTARVTIGEGLPFAYFQVTGGNAQITTTATPTIWSNNGSTIGYTAGGHDYVAYAPTGATWTVSGTAITSTLAGRGYFSIAALPGGTADRAALATSYARYAHNHVTGTRLSYSYNPATSLVTTTYTYTTTARETLTTPGTVIALLPHQWNYLAGATPIAQTYVSARGPLKVLTGASSFTTSMRFQGVLPEIPAVGDNTGADLATLNAYLNAESANPMRQVADDTYWTGKGLGRAARLAEIADQVGNTAVRTSALAAIKTTLTDWFTAPAGKTSHVFSYNSAWGTLIGYPASFGSDSELNDHHFHYGYFIAAAATLAKFDPTWASQSQYGGMVDLLIRDADSYDRTDTRFPFLRDFDIYDGHDWASGHGSFFAGNNQESSSEGMDFDNALIQWGQATGNTAIRDAGVFMYTTQAAAIHNYWFDSNNQNFPTTFGHNEVGMVWGDGGAYSTWFSAAPEQIQGINMLPITGGHLYLGYNPAYVLTNYNEMISNRGGGQPAIWADILYEFLALGNGDSALANFRANSGFTSEEGDSKAHTFHWVRNLAALGTVDTSVTADYPLSAAFVKNGARTYVASNPGSAAITVRFSNGTTVAVPAGRTVASGALNWSGGSAAGGTNPTPGPTPTSVPTPTGSPTPSPTVSPTRSPTPSPTTGPPGPAVAVRYPQTGGALSGTTAAAGTATVAAAGGTVHDGTPTNPLVYTATGLTMAYGGGATAFDLYVDAGSGVGNATQVRVSYDLTGDGVVDRVETYRYFATDPVAGYEHYTQAAQLLSSSGALGNLTNGQVRVEVWSAIGTAPTTLGTGNQSVIRLPYS